MCRICMGNYMGNSVRAARGLLVPRMLFLPALFVCGTLETARGTCLVFLGHLELEFCQWNALGECLECLFSFPLKITEILWISLNFTENTCRIYKWILLKEKPVKYTVETAWNPVELKYLLWRNWIPCMLEWTRNSLIFLDLKKNCHYSDTMINSGLRMNILR